MSIFGDHKCPKCGKQWTGSLGWDSVYVLNNYDHILIKICGCTDLKLTDEDMEKLKSITTMK